MKSFLVSIVLLLLLSGASWGIWQVRLELQRREHEQAQIEIQQHIQQAAQGGFKELARFFESYARDKGAQQAFELLRTAELPPDTDFHLLGHVIGDVLYEQEGVSAMKTCTSEFRNACSHTLVAGAYMEFGEEAINKIMAACQEAPGGKGAYDLCFHGLGHGVLAQVGYDFKRVIPLCERFGTPEHNYRERDECVGGAMMELVGGGGHNPTGWMEQHAAYLGTSDPLFPCNAAYVPKAAKPRCFLYMTPHLMEKAGANPRELSVESLKPAFAYCSKLTEVIDRNWCYGGFGKEFVVLVNKRDIRTVENLTDEQFQTVEEWCGAAPSSQAARECHRQAINSLYWGGTNDVGASERFCNQLDDVESRASCKQHLDGLVSYFSSEY